MPFVWLFILLYDLCERMKTMNLQRIKTLEIASIWHQHQEKVKVAWTAELESEECRVQNTASQLSFGCCCCCCFIEKGNWGSTHISVSIFRQHFRSLYWIMNECICICNVYIRTIYARISDDDSMALSVFRCFNLDQCRAHTAHKQQLQDATWAKRPIWSFQIVYLFSYFINDWCICSYMFWIEAVTPYGRNSVHKLDLACKCSEQWDQTGPNIWNAINNDLSANRF